MLGLPSPPAGEGQRPDANCGETTNLGDSKGNKGGPLRQQTGMPHTYEAKTHSPWGTHHREELC